MFNKKKIAKHANRQKTHLQKQSRHHNQTRVLQRFLELSYWEFKVIMIDVLRIKWKKRRQHVITDD